MPGIRTASVIFFQVVIDIFRSHDLSGWAKTGWLVFIVILPLIGLLVYAIYHTFNYDREYRFPLDEVIRAEDERTRLLATARG